MNNEFRVDIVTPFQAKAEKTRKEIASIVEHIGDQEEVLGEKLAAVYDYQMYIYGDRQYASFEQYLNKELGRSLRWGYYRVKVHKVFKSLGITHKQLRSIGWSKKRELAPIITNANYKEMLQYARHHTVMEIRSAVRKKKSEKGIDSGRPIGNIQIPIYNEDQRNFFESVLDLAGKMAGSDRRTPQMEIIFAEFQGTYGVRGSHDQEELNKEIEDWEIFEAFGWRCAIADCRSPLTLQNHHKEYRSRRPDLIDDPRNKLPICLRCHNRIHLRGGKLIEIGGEWAIKMPVDPKALLISQGQAVSSG